MTGVQTCALPILSLYLVSVAGHGEVSVAIQRKVAGTGIKLPPSVLYDEVSFSADRHVRRHSRALQATAGMDGFDRTDLDAQTDLSRIDPTDWNAVVRRTRASHRLIDHVTEVNDIPLESDGVHIRDVVAGHVQIGLMRLDTADGRIKRTKHLLVPQYQ